MTGNLRMGHLGNGLLVWNTKTNKDVAHISKARKITYYGRVSAPDRAKIMKEARVSDPSVSATQSEKVFATRPKRR